MDVNDILLRPRPDVNVTNKEMDKLLDEMRDRMFILENWEMYEMLKLVQDRFRVLSRSIYANCIKTCPCYPLNCSGCNNNIYEEE